MLNKYLKSIFPSLVLLSSALVYANNTSVQTLISENNYKIQADPLLFNSLRKQQSAGRYGQPNKYHISLSLNIFAYSPFIYNLNTKESTFSTTDESKRDALYDELLNIQSSHTSMEINRKLFRHYISQLDECFEVFSERVIIAVPEHNISFNGFDSFVVDSVNKNNCLT